MQVEGLARLAVWRSRDSWDRRGAGSGPWGLVATVLFVGKERKTG